MLLSLVPLTNLSHLVNNKKNKPRNVTSESEAASLRTEKTLLKFIMKAKNEQRLFIFSHIENVSKLLD